MTSVKENLICFRCKHWKLHDFGCLAFDEIPDIILQTNSHNKPLPNQGNKYVFEEGFPVDFHIISSAYPLH